MKIPKYFYFRVKPINKGTGIELEDASDVDVVEVVRCKDCKNRNEVNCPQYYRRAELTDGYYCADAERREVTE